MASQITFDSNKCLSMDPLALIDYLSSTVSFDTPDDVSSTSNQRIAADTITKATAYASFFTEMETKARIMKRQAKLKKEKDDFERLISIEEIFKSYKEIAKMQIENVAKIMTLKRLELEEQKNCYRA